MKAIEIENISLKRGKELVLDNITLSLEVGEFMGILGSPGAGKSTLLNILATLIKPDEGKFRLLGSEPRQGKASIFSKIGIWLEEDFLIPFLSVWQNLWLFSLFLGIPYRLRKARISKYLSLAGIWELRKRPVESLSRGEKGLVNVARTLLNEPYLLILDEPERELGPKEAHFLLQQILRLREEHNTAVLWASAKGEWFSQADRIAIMKKGRIIACDTPLNLKRTFLKEFYTQENTSLEATLLERVFLSYLEKKNG